MNSSGQTAKYINLWREINWFAVHTKARRENFAATNVSALGIETLLPQLKVEHLVIDPTRTTVKPLFPGYCFARFCPEACLESVECSPGVLRVVSSGRFPLPVGEEVIREIEDRTGQDGFVRIRAQNLKPGDRVSILDGPFEGLMGRVERELDDGKRVAIFLETLLHARVQIEKRWLEAHAA